MQQQHEYIEQFMLHLMSTGIGYDWVIEKSYDYAMSLQMEILPEATARFKAAELIAFIFPMARRTHEDTRRRKS
jgi:hypothetical protein